MNYSTDGESMNTSAEVDQTFVNFFGSVGTFIRNAFNISKDCENLQNARFLEDLELNGIMGSQKWSDVDLKYHQQILAIQTQVCHLPMPWVENAPGLHGSRNV